MEIQALFMNYFFEIGYNQNHIVDQGCSQGGFFGVKAPPIMEELFHFARVF